LYWSSNLLSSLLCFGCRSLSDTGLGTLPLSGTWSAGAVGFTTDDDSTLSFGENWSFETFPCGTGDLLSITPRLVSESRLDMQSLLLGSTLSTGLVDNKRKRTTISD
jgi:hypothetical protein